MIRDTGWFKSSYSAGASDNCVEVRVTECTTSVRDTKNRSSRLDVPTAAWLAFIAAELRGFET
ncbi:DUF397 domain-containing protein [Kibdelosporangium persicum]|uniref:DUF397 domain-containing protein n=1 Tax=Kibdelosporangium persicum TaxID=2698649 RepID=UPI0028AF8D13|nr:DUF397 domain-containing protein [Kibdelosporangium persicum]